MCVPVRALHLVAPYSTTSSSSAASTTQARTGSQAGAQDNPETRSMLAQVPAWLWYPSLLAAALALLFCWYLRQARRRSSGGGRRRQQPL
mmetsp:Transcript_34280/g.76050  ORF Transcript_34280/g.76050 Transcript_34280/m.76050 type:complete len:90 (+) Transcript_34280:414-683(+)